MKKKLIMIAAICISMGMLAGCGGTDKTDSAKSENSAEETAEETLMYESKNVRITYLGEDESFLGPKLKVKIENLSNKNIKVQTNDDLSVNDMMINTLFSANVAEGKTAIDSIPLLNSYLEENNITEIEKVELSFHILEADTFKTIEDTETVTLALN